MALLGLGFLIAAQLASEGPRIRITSQERTPLVETAKDLQVQQEALKQQILELRTAIQDLEATGQGGAAVTRDLNGQLQRARIAAGLVTMSGPGIVIQLSDSSVQRPAADANARDYLVSGLDVQTVVEELWLAGAEAIAVNNERVTVATAIVDIGGSVLVNSAYVTAPYQVSAIGPGDMFERLARSTGFVDFVRGRAETFGIGVSYATPASRGPARLRGIGQPPLRPDGAERHAHEPRPLGRHAHDPQPEGGPLMRRRSGRLAMGAVLLILGFLVVVQLRSQAADQGLAALSVQDLTELVANVTTRNNQLRQEIRTLESQRASVGAAVERGDTSTVQIRSDLNRILGWSGALGVTGAGVRVTVDGPVPGDAVEELLNELRNAGAEAISIDGVRVVPGVVVAGPADALLVSGTPLSGAIEILAVGHPESLAGSLARAGGPIAQLSVRYPDVAITVDDADRVEIPPTDRDLDPVLGHPRL